MRCGWVIAMLLPALAFCQTLPSFEAASIKVNDQPDQAGSINPNPEGLTAHNVSVKFCVEMAWRVKDYQLSIPAAFRDSMDSHYDIVARAAGPVSADQRMQMFQNLLIERFHLAVHFEKKDQPVFALVVPKDGPKNLHDPAPGNKPHMDPGTVDATGARHWTLFNEPVSALMGLISNGLSRPLIDRTGLEGSYDFAFVLPAWNRADGPLGDFMVADVFPEVQRQLGLRIEARTAPIDILVVDRIDKVPTAN